MLRSARALFVVALGWLCLASAAQAGPILSTGPYVVNLPPDGQYQVSGSVDVGGAGYIYTYTVTNLTQVQRAFELGIAEDPALFGLYSESNPHVNPGVGELLRDQPALIHYGPDIHNYAFTHVNGHVRVGISVAAGQTQTMSFEDPHPPTLTDWELRERSPHGAQRKNTQLGLGQLPAPSGAAVVSTVGAPEPATLTLAVVGIGGLGLGVLRKRRRPQADA